MVRAVGLILALAAALTVPAAAHDLPLTLQLSTPETGWVGATIAGRHGATVEVFERVGGQDVPVKALPFGSADVIQDLRFDRWRCDRRSRTYVARSTRADGTPEESVATVATPNCRLRLSLAARPARPRVGRLVGLDVKDFWKVGDVVVRLCVRAPGAREACRKADLATGKSTRRLRVRVTRPGRWSARLVRAGQTADRVAWTAKRPGGRLRVLATGDSMIQIIDSFLKQRLDSRPGVSVRSDAHISTGISKLGSFNWISAAKRQASSGHPDVTVMFLGANDGFPMKTPGGATADCCGDAWVAEYARRARQMMRAYLRQGAGRVYWLLLPTPRPANFAKVFRAVNEAHRRAARSFPDGVRLIDLVKVFSPGGRFRPRHRQADGIHLNTEGASITAGIIIRALRADGLIP